MQWPHWPREGALYIYVTFLKLLKLMLRYFLSPAITFYKQWSNQIKTFFMFKLKCVNYYTQNYANLTCVTFGLQLQESEVKPENRRTNESKSTKPTVETEDKSNKTHTNSTWQTSVFYSDEVRQRERKLEQFTFTNQNAWPLFILIVTSRYLANGHSPIRIDFIHM